MRRMTLLISADDTLWKNNAFFEDTIERFLNVVEPFGYTRGYARHVLNETERLNIRQHGYGVRSLAQSLLETYSKLAGDLAQEQGLGEVQQLAAGLEQTPPQVLEGVPETLQYLSDRHRLLLFTRGEAAEQAGKVERSGLQGFFEAIEIIGEKSAETYDGIVAKHHVVKSHAWLVGTNSREEIVPGLQSGLNAAFIPQRGNGEQEMVELHNSSGKLIVLASFRGLREHF